MVPLNDLFARTVISLEFCTDTVHYATINENIGRGPSGLVSTVGRRGETDRLIEPVGRRKIVGTLFSVEIGINKV